MDEYIHGYRIDSALLLPFPVSLVGAIGGVMLLNFLRTRLMMKKMGISMNGLFGSLSSQI